MKIIYTDVLVIGAGLAGLRIGIGAKRRGHDVIILSLVPPKRSHSAAAQGGRGEASHVDRHLGGRGRAHLEGREVEEAAVVLDHLAGPREPHHLDHLVHARAARF